MSREIKFRVWDKENKEMYYTVNTIKNNSILEMLITFDLLGASVFVSEYGREDIKEVNDFELMQFTGLKDKNETDIYEGDVVRDTEDRAIQEVVWKNNGFKLKYTFQRSYMGEKYMETKYLELGETDSRRWGVEVIGNVFENPELLESEVE